MRSSLGPLNIAGEDLNVPVTAKASLTGALLIITDIGTILKKLLTNNVRGGISIFFSGFFAQPTVIYTAFSPQTISQLSHTQWAPHLGNGRCKTFGEIANILST